MVNSAPFLSKARIILSKKLGFCSYLKDKDAQKERDIIDTSQPKKLMYSTACPYIGNTHLRVSRTQAETQLRREQQWLQLHVVCSPVAHYLDEGEPPGSD